MCVACGGGSSAQPELGEEKKRGREGNGARDKREGGEGEQIGEDKIIQVFFLHIFAN